MPHQEVRQVGAQIGNELFTMADFSRLNTTCKFLVLMPQWDFLDFIAAQARNYKSFTLRMNTEATDIIKENGRIVGVKAQTPAGEIEIRSQLIIGADGRNSIIRKSAGFHVRDIGAPMDILWLRFSRLASDPPQTLGRIKAGIIFIMLNRENYWQCGFVIKKDGFEEISQAGIEAFRTNILDIAPFLADRIGELKTWDDVKLLTVKVDRLTEWHKDGLLCIGDSAHAMSPIGGVGINLAIQDAVATANLLWQPLTQGRCSNADLARVQQQRTYPTLITQGIQVLLQNNVISRTLSSKTTKVPLLFKLFKALPVLQRIPGYFIGIGFRPEHIKSPHISNHKQ